MHIKELTLIGFKSFADKTTLRFSPGMNAIIGPNGCGKTNVLDALRWVLGEQSFSMLRCARNEDLIFGGTATVPASNYAEVRLVLAEDGRANAISIRPADTASKENDVDLAAAAATDKGTAVSASEIEIRRRYYRSGESEYFLNRQPCRLRDIQDFFLSSGAGTKTYSIFDLRQIREIIAGNIRRLFEEAATLARYQEAKAECLRKLSLTEQDLTRLDDIIAERERVVRSLGRQAGRLKAYEKLKAEEKALRLIELRAEYDSLRRAVEQAELDVAALEQADAGRLAEIHRLEEELAVQRSRLRDMQAARDAATLSVRKQRDVVTALENANLLAEERIRFLRDSATTAAAEQAAATETLASLEQALAAAAERLEKATGAVAAASERLASCRERVRTTEEGLFRLREHESALAGQLAELLEKQQQLRQELARLEADRDNHSAALARLGTELATLKERSAKATAARDAAAARLAAASDEIDRTRRSRQDLEAELAKINAARSDCRNRLAKLRDEQAAVERELAVLRTALAQDQAETVQQLIGERFVGGIESFLTIEPGWERATEAVLYALVDFLVTSGEFDPTWLERLAAARPDLRFGLLTMAPANSTSDAPPASKEPLPHRLLEHIQVRPDAPPVLAATLARALVCNGPAEFAELATAYPGWNLVTPEGCCRFADGRVVLESRDRGRLSLSSLVAAGVARLQQLDAEVTALRQQDAELGRQHEELDRQLSATALGLFEAQNEKASLDATLAAAEISCGELARDAERLQAEQQSVLQAAQTNRERLVQVAGELDELKRRILATETALGTTRTDVAHIEKEVKELLAAAQQALAELAEKRQLVVRLEAENDFLRRQLDEHRLRRNARERQLTAAQEEIARLTEQIAGRADELAAAQQALAEFEAAAATINLGDVVAATEAIETNLAELRRAQEQSTNLLLEQRLELYKLNQQVQACLEEAKTSYATDLAGYVPVTEPGVTTTELLERLAQLRRRIEALGQVNSLAGEEYASEKADLEKLRAQRDDVAQAKINLNATLAGIDRHAQEQFIATYSLVRDHFQAVFRQLFLDGEADLVLTDPTNPLQSEIGIVARPRGKNPKLLAQLSDGEKALLAVSLLFAFYRVKPAPFCFLDEVDAPLDDANVGRFADYLRNIAEQTQVIIITHNRLTVERANVVFGVTAEQPGISKLVAVNLAEYQTDESRMASTK